MVKQASAGSQVKSPPKVEKKRKSKVSKKKRKAKRKASQAPPRSERNYEQELMEYVQSWERREEGSGWKFNKVLQNWAIDNVFDRSLIKKDSLKPTLRYLKSVEGSARQRIIDKAKDIIANSEEDLSPKAAIRATRVLKLFPDYVSP